VSDDGKWALSASSDTTVKLWSMAMPTTSYATFNYSDSSVWCLASQSPTLSTFWAGARDGWVYKVNNKFLEDDDSSDAIAICKEEHPVLRIAAIEDAYVWTATTSSTIHRWRDVSFDADRDLIVPDSCYCHPDDASDAEIESLRSKVPSIVSAMDKTKSAPILSNEMVHSESCCITPLWIEPEHVIPGLPGIKKSLLLNNKRHVITQDTDNQVCVWDIIYCKKVKELGNVDFEEACNEQNTPEWIANWCTVDTKNGDLTIHLEEGKCYDSEMYHQDLQLSKEAANEDQRISLAKWILTYLLFEHLKEVYPNNPSFASNPSPGKPEPLQLTGLSSYSSMDTPSMNVSLATPLSKLAIVETPDSIPKESGSLPVPELPTSPLSPISPMSPSSMAPEAALEPQDDPYKAPKPVPTRNPSFIERLKFKRGRTTSGKSQEDPVPPPTPPRTTSFQAEKVSLVD
jgi:WD repeat-containing protein 48